MRGIDEIARDNAAAVEREAQYAEARDKLKRYEEARQRDRMTEDEYFYKSDREGGRFMTTGKDVRENGLDCYRSGAYGAGASDIWYRPSADAWFADK